ncbi:MAG: hypothetical protein PHW94_06295 [Sulfurimonas sp.]|nr:hypothetical protein [Sulfurimonas sp.]
MRSRDGNRLSARSIFKLVLLFYSLALSASEYLISYRYVVQDAILYNETLSVAKSMQKCSGSAHDALLLESDGSDNLKQINSKNEDEFLSFIHTLGLDVKHSEINTNLQNSSTTILTLKTTCFKVDFNDNFARITALN